MLPRRSILTGALALAAHTGGGRALAGAGARTRSAGIAGATPCDETIRRMPGMGDGYKMTWTADDRQLVVQNDGTGWSTKPQHFYKRSLWFMSGAPDAIAVDLVPGYPSVEHGAEPEDVPDYHGHGLLAVRGRVYQFLGALDRGQDGLRRWSVAKLIYSDDGGRHWRNHDGTTPVRDEGWRAQSPATMAFCNEADGCFSLLGFVQMGRGYRANRDGYIYVFGPNGNTDGQMNQLMMFRVPIGRMLDRSAYAFFAGRAPSGAPIWRPEIAARQPVHEFPRGWVNHKPLFAGDIVVETWLPSIVYNAGLGVYLMASSGTGCAADGTEFARPGYFGLWVADAPWGPWRQIYETMAWTPGGDPEARPYSPQISPKWIAADGSAFWLAWSDLKGIRSLTDAGPSEGAASPPASAPTSEGPLSEAASMALAMPGLRMNLQRIDLAL